MTHGEFSTLVMYWRHYPAPERLDEMLAFAEKEDWAKHPERQLPLSGIVLAFERLYPDMKQTWRAKYPVLYGRITEALKLPKSLEFWSDFLLSGWFILRRDEFILEILERAGPDGRRCRYTAAMINQAAQNFIPFRKAAERLRLPVSVTLD